MRKTEVKVCYLNLLNTGLKNALPSLTCFISALISCLAEVQVKFDFLSSFQKDMRMISLPKCERYGDVNNQICER